MKEGRSKERKNEATKDRLKGKRTNNKQENKRCKLRKEGQKNKKICFRNHENVIKIGARGHPNREKWRPGVPPRSQKKTKMKKNVDPLNSGVPFLSIFVENGSQDGGPNPSKIDKKSI